MLKKMTYGFGLFVAMFALMFTLTLSWAYGDDKVTCAAHGYTSNSISPSLEGFCSKEIAPNVIKTVSVDGLRRIAERRSKTVSVAICVLSRKDPENC